MKTFIHKKLEIVTRKIEILLQIFLERKIPFTKAINMLLVSIFSKPERPLIATFSIPLFFTITISISTNVCYIFVSICEKEIYIVYHLSNGTISSNNQVVSDILNNYFSNIVRNVLTLTNKISLSKTQVVLT